LLGRQRRGPEEVDFSNTSTFPAWQIGLASEFVQSASTGGTVLQDDLYTWSQDPAGNPYISTRASTTGQGTLNVVTATSTQTLDQYGNVTQSVIYPYNNTTTPLKTFTNTYLNSSTYPSNYIFNRLLSSSVTPSGGSPITLLTNSYDVPYNCSYAVSSGSSTPCSGWAAPASGPIYNVDPSPPIPLGQRGYLNSSVTPAKSTTIAVYTYGSPAMAWGSDGSVSSASADTSTDFNAPVTMTSQRYSTTLAYNSWLGVTQTTGANGEQMSMSYDANGRPASGTSPYCGSGCYGPTVSYSYGTSAPSRRPRPDRTEKPSPRSMDSGDRFWCLAATRPRCNHRPRLSTRRAPARRWRRSRRFPSPTYTELQLPPGPLIATTGWGGL
jgi:hypothetical protein